MPQVILQSFKETLAAGEYRPIYFYSNILTILGNTAGSEIYIGVGELPPIALKAGLQVMLPQGDSFNKILLYNQEAVETTVEFILSAQEVRDNRMSVSGQVNVSDLAVLEQLRGKTTAGSYSQHVVSSVPVKVFDVNANRIGCIVQAKESNVGIVHLGFTDAVTVTNYFGQLQAGMSLSLNNYRGEIWAISDVASQYIGRGEW